MAEEDLVSLRWLMLWGVGGLVIVWAVLPPLMGLLGFTTFHNGAKENPDDLSGTQGFVETSGFLARFLAALVGIITWTALRVATGPLRGVDDGGLLSLSQLLIIGAGLSAAMMVLAIAKSRRGPVTEGDPHTEDVYRQLRALGFKPLGTYWEHAWFLAYHWCLTARERIFYSREQRAFAAVYRYVVSEPVRTAFKTCFRGGGFLITGNHSESEDMRVESDKYLRWGHVTNDLAEVLALHQSEVEKFQAKGWVPDTHDNFVTLLPVEEEFGTWSLGSDKKLPAVFLGIQIVLLGILPVLASCHYGPTHWSVPVGILAGVGLKLGLENVLNEQITQERRQEVAREGSSQDLPTPWC